MGVVNYLSVSQDPEEARLQAMAAMRATVNLPCGVSVSDFTLREEDGNNKQGKRGIEDKT